MYIYHAIDTAPPSHELLLLHVALPAVALLLLSPLVMAAFLSVTDGSLATLAIAFTTLLISRCCPGGSNTKQTFSRTFSKRDKGYVMMTARCYDSSMSVCYRKGLSASTDISINITDSSEHMYN